MIVIPFLASLFIVPAGEQFVCTPTRVWDGDGPIWCAEGPRIRLRGIATRELDGSCRGHQPCPEASGIEARDRLVELLGGAKGRSREGHVLVKGPTMQCLSMGWAEGTRTAAWCSAPAIGDLSCAMLRTGTALPWKIFDGDRVCRRP